MNFWVNTVSRAHVLVGVAGGFTQAGHGTKTGLARLRLHDRIVFYSPREALRCGAPVQAFTALGVVDDAVPFAGNDLGRNRRTARRMAIRQQVRA